MQIHPPFLTHATLILREIHELTTRKATILNLNNQAFTNVELALSPQVLQLELDQLHQASELSTFVIAY
jgi:hypothetical protein